MSTQTDNIKYLLTKLGFGEDQINVYICLLEKSPQTALQISRTISMGRTKVYRCLEQLNRKGLVNTLIDANGSKFEANSPRQIGILIKEEEMQLDKLKIASTTLMQNLEQMLPSAFGATKINYYKGIEGLKQITWNSLQATDGIRIYEIENMEAFLDRDFSEKIRLEMQMKNIPTYQLTNLTYSPPFTVYKKLVRNLWDYRYISPSKLSLQIETMIYSDTFVMYSYENSEVFGVEIHSSRLAQMQKQIFDLIFSAAKPMTILSDQGEARLDE